MTGAQPIRFVTSNPGKLREARALLPVPIEPVEIAIEEIQAASLETITLHKLEQARRHVDGPVFVEDVALGFDALQGFPGPYIKWLLTSAGGEGVGRIAAGLPDPGATAVCHLAYWDGRVVTSFVGECRGRLLSSPQGAEGFGWDAWFLPNDFQVTYAEMSQQDKARVSHRGHAYRKFSTFLMSGA